MKEKDLESKTEDDNLVKLPFNSPMGNPIYLPKDSEVMDVIKRVDWMIKDSPRFTSFSTFEKQLKDYFPKPYSADCITEFSKLLSKEMFKEQVSDLNVVGFLNFLIQKSSDQEHLIDTTSNSYRFTSFGYRNTKDITIEGNLGDFVGDGMKAGSLYIAGNAGKNLGIHMKGGTIHVDGDFETISLFIEGGDIYHKGKQIVKNGEVLDESYREW